VHRILSARVLIFSAVLLCLDQVLPPLIQFRMIQPLLLPLFVVYAAFYWGDSRVMALAALIGILRDFNVSSVFGAALFSMVVMSFFLRWAVQKADRDSLFVKELTVFVFVMGELFLERFVSGLGSANSTEGFFVLWQGVLIAAAYTAVLAPVFFYVANGIFQEPKSVIFRQYELFR